MSEASSSELDLALRQQLRRRLSGFELHTVETDPAPPMRLAAVALTLVEAGLGPDLEGLPNQARWSKAPALLLTKRAGTLRSHPGQWALPGGRLDAGESPEQAALRELAEEVGLDLGAEAVLGRLDDFETRSGFLMMPVVVWGGAATGLRANPAEVASMHRIPLTELLRTDAPLLDVEPGLPAPVLRMPLGSQHIAAPTAAILYQFREVCLCGRPTRVAHYEQPRFAWR